MEWLSEDIDRGQTVLTCIALVITATLIWLGRKKLVIAIPCALIFLLLAAIAIPSFIPARPMAHRNACINNLRQIRDAKIEWARVNHKLPTNVPTEADLYGTNGTNGFLRHKWFVLMADDTHLALSMKTQNVVLLTADTYCRNFVLTEFTKLSKFEIGGAN